MSLRRVLSKVLVAQPTGLYKVLKGAVARDYMKAAMDAVATGAKDDALAADVEQAQMELQDLKENMVETQEPNVVFMVLKTCIEKVSATLKSSSRMFYQDQGYKDSIGRVIKL